MPCRIMTKVIDCSVAVAVLAEFTGSWCKHHTSDDHVTLWITRQYTAGMHWKVANNTHMHVAVEDHIHLGYRQAGFIHLGYTVFI